MTVTSQPSASSDVHESGDGSFAWCPDPTATTPANHHEVALPRNWSESPEASVGNYAITVAMAAHE